MNDFRPKCAKLSIFCGYIISLFLPLMVQDVYNWILAVVMTIDGIGYYE